jgi:Domain of unknown function (DUF4184)
MPFTFLSHQAPVLPLKMVRPDWFDGTALVMGSMAPDLALFAYGTGVNVDSHSIAAQFWLCLPLTLILTWTVKRLMAAPLGAHLPDGGGFHLRDYGRLGAWRPPRTVSGWGILVASAVVGSLSHIIADAFTHDSGWAVENLAPLRTPVFELPSNVGGHTLYVYSLLQGGLSLVGAAVTIWLLLVIGRRRCIAAWHPVPNPLAPTPASRRLLLGWTLVGAIAGLVAAIAVHTDGRHEVIIWFAAFAFLGLLVGCLTARLTMTTIPQPPRPDTARGAVSEFSA